MTDKTMKTEIVKLDMAQYGLEENKATEIKNLYVPMIKMLTDMEAAFNTVVGKEITTELSFEARDLRLKIAKVRTDADKARKGAKAEYLRANNAIQGAYNAVEYATKSKEEKLLAIEKHLEIIEQERKAKLKEERELALVKYEVETEHINLGEMNLEVWTSYFEGVKLQHENKIAAEKKVEADRKAEEEKKQRKADRINKVSEIGLLWRGSTKTYGFNDIDLPEEDLINMESDEFDKKIQEISIGIKERTKAINEAAKKGEEERKAAEVKAKIAEKARIKAEAERAEALAKAKKAAEAKAKIEAELQAKKDAEIKAESDKQEAIEAELSASDKEKFQSVISDLTELKTKYSFKSKKYQKLQGSVNQLIDKIIAFSEEKTN